MAEETLSTKLTDFIENFEIILYINYISIKNKKLAMDTCKCTWVAGRNRLQRSTRKLFLLMEVLYLGYGGGYTTLFFVKTHRIIY